MLTGSSPRGRNGSYGPRLNEALEMLHKFLGQRNIDVHSGAEIVSCHWGPFGLIAAHPDRIYFRETAFLNGAFGSVDVVKL